LRVRRVGGDDAGDRGFEAQDFDAGVGETGLHEPFVELPAGPGAGVSGGAGAARLAGDGDPSTRAEQAAQLADEIHFWVNPAVWGSGDRAFHGRQVQMEQIATTTFDSGVTLLCYRPAPDQQASATT
jgi:hypothetical protein